MPPFIAALSQLLGRLLLSAIFIQAGLGKLSNPASTMAYIGSAGIPNPEIAYYITLAVELGGGLLILLGLFTRPAALLLAGFCLVSGAMFHYHPGDIGQMTNFMKNLAIAGGFLQLFAVGAGMFSVDAMRRRSVLR